MLFEHQVTCVYSLEATDGDEVIMFGCDDGFVYQMYKGTSMDGDAINWYADLAYDHFKSPLTWKAYLKAMLEVAGSGYSEYQFSYDLEYGSSDVNQPGLESEEIGLSRSDWDTGYWDVGFWDTHDIEPVYFPMLGSGTNMSVRIQGNYDYCASLKFSGAVIQYKITREKR